MFGKEGTVRSRSIGRAIMLLGVVFAALIWAGKIPVLSELVWQSDARLRDELPRFLEPTAEREDLVFLGIGEDRKDAGLDAATLAQSRALRLMQQNVGNERLDRRVFAELIEKLAAAGTRMIIFDILFVGPSGNGEADREFAAALLKHHDRIVLSLMLQPGRGSYHPIRSVKEIPFLAHADRLPHEGYVNLWPDVVDGVVRRSVYTTTVSELENIEYRKGEPMYESLSAVAGRLMGVKAPEERAPRLRYAVSDDGDGTFAEAYAPVSLRSVFEPQRWKDEYENGAFFKDKVVLISTAALRDEDYHPIPGAVIYGGQYHLQALGSLLEDGYWRDSPQWVELTALLGMAGVALLCALVLRHPITLVTFSIALGGGFLVVCGVVSSTTGVLFPGTPGIVGLGAVTLFGALGQIVARTHVRPAAKMD